MKRLIITASKESVKLVGSPTPDGTVLIQRDSNGTLATVNYKELKVVDGDRGDR